MEERVRLKGYELNALMRYNIALCILRDQEGFDKRLAMLKNGKKFLRSAAGMLDAMIDSVYRTVPKEQLMTIKRQIMDTTYTIGVKCKATQSDDKYLENYGAVVPYAVLDEIFAACKDHCITCIATPAEAKGCALRKALDVVPNDAEDKDDGSCPYRDVL